MSGTERQTDAARRDATANPARDAQDATATQGAATPLIELRNISKRFGERPVGAAGRLLQRAGLSRPPAVTRAVDGVDLIVRPGEVVGLVGESGCGKSTLGRVAAGLLTPSGGEVRINGLRPADMTPAQAHQARLKVQMIFQDPYASLNPRLRVDEIVGEAAHPRPGRPGRVRRLRQRPAAARRPGPGPAPALSAPVQRRPAPAHRHRPRAGGAAVHAGLRRGRGRAGRIDPGADPEPVHGPARGPGLTYLFISHDLGVVEHLSDRVVIMYLGRVVETATVQEVFQRPNHPYTQALLAEIPDLKSRRKVFTAIKGEIPSPLNPPDGCHFHPRCPHAMPRCKTEVPTLKGIAIHHHSACHLNDMH